MSFGAGKVYIDAFPAPISWRIDVIEKVVSGGQTGADQAGWRAAKNSGILTFGYMPKGFKTEVGPRPKFAELYGAVEHESPDYPPRTLANVKEAEATFWFGRGDSRGFACTSNACKKAGLPIWTVLDPDSPTDRMVTLVRGMRYTSLNIAGNRESLSRGIGEWVEKYLMKVFHIINVLDQDAWRRSS